MGIKVMNFLNYVDRNIYYLLTVTAKSYFMEIVETCLSI